MINSLHHRDVGEIIAWMFIIVNTKKNMKDYSISI